MTRGIIRVSILREFLVARSFCHTVKSKIFEKKFLKNFKKTNLPTRVRWKKHEISPIARKLALGKFHNNFFELELFKRNIEIQLLLKCC